MNSNTSSKNKQDIRTSVPLASSVEQLAYLQSLLSGHVPPERPVFDQDVEPYIKQLEKIARASKGKGRAIETAWEGMRLKFQVDTQLAKLKELDALLEESRQPQPATAEVTRPESLIPPLPEGVAFSPEQSRAACKWLDEYEQFSRVWSPRGYDHFHAATGSWVLSSVAARRVWLPFGPGGEYTPLFIALVAHTTQHAKSTTAGIGKEILRQSGLSWLLCPDTITPQKLLSNMSGHLPKNFQALSEQEQAIALRRYAMSGQVSWFYDEFGQHLDAMTAKNGIMADFKGILRRFDDCEEETSNDTLTRDLERIERPYMSLLASMTPADIRPYAGKDAKFWKDGTFARFVFITPPPDDRKRDRFPDGEMCIPPGLIEPLTRWHQRLGEPHVELIAETNKKGEVTGYQTIREPLSQQTCMLASGVIDAFYTYNDALADIVHNHHLEQLAGNYGRMAKKALRLAMLFASLENNGHIEIRHWARAQEIAETWRACLHELYAQVATPENSENESIENDIIEFLKSRKKPMSARDIRLSSRKFRAIPANDFRSILDNMALDGAIERVYGKVVMYQALAGSENNEK